MSHPIQIGLMAFSSKKEALSHYKTILNSYNFGEYLTDGDFSKVLALLPLHPRAEEKIGAGVKAIRIAKLKFNTRSFELVRNDGTCECFSYTKRINSPESSLVRFRKSCRHGVQEDLRRVKQAYFDKHSKKGNVKCQETGELLKWEELNIDHRQPNTFSVIVERFIELHGIDVDAVKYEGTDIFESKIVDENLNERFRQYHKEKANLRLVKKDLNIGRSYQARSARQRKDLSIE